MFELEVPAITYTMFKFTPAKSQDTCDFDEILTPPSIDYETTDSSMRMLTDTPLSEPTNLELNGSYSEVHHRKPLGRFHSFDVKRSLFTSKRFADVSAEEHPESSSSKRIRDTETAFGEFTLESPTYSDNEEVKTALNLLSKNQDLVADSSRKYALPTVPGKHHDLKSITSDTLKDVMSGCYDDKVDKVTVIDCRYPYEFDGGHIKGALNLYTRDAIQAFLNENSRTGYQKQILIFHCEFSSERGPRMYRYLRSQDRDMNKDNYPRLNFPEIYLLDGGYKACFFTHKELCEPQTYLPMLHKDFSSDLRRFRAKSKSWTAGEKVRPTSRLTLRF